MWLASHFHLLGCISLVASTLLSFGTMCIICGLHLTFICCDTDCCDIHTYYIYFLRCISYSIWEAPHFFWCNAYHTWFAPHFHLIRCVLHVALTLFPFAAMLLQMARISLPFAVMRITCGSRLTSIFCYAYCIWLAPRFHLI